MVRARRKDNTLASFGNVVEFVEYAAESANDPVYGKGALGKTKPRTRDSTEDDKEFLLSKFKSASSPTNVNAATKPHFSHGPGLPAKTLAYTDSPCAIGNMVWIIARPMKGNP